MIESDLQKCPYGYGEDIPGVPFLEDGSEAAMQHEKASKEPDDYDPSIHESRADFKELQEALDPLSRLAAARIELAVNAEPIRFRERARAISSYGVSYAPMIATLPPGLFGGGAPELPDSLAGVYELVKSFAESPDVIANQDVMVGQWKYDLESALQARNVYADPFPFDTQTWRAYEHTYAEHKAKGTAQDLLELWVYRSREIAKAGRPGSVHPDKFAPYSGRFTDFVYAAAENGQPPKLSVPRNIVMPVGAYGQPFSDRLLRTTVLTIEALATNIDGEAAIIAGKHADVLARRTARGRSEQNMQFANDYTLASTDPITAATPKAILQEGALSIMQALALLTADHVSGYDNPDVLLHDLINQGVIERFTRKIPLAFVGPLTVKGAYYPHPLEVVEGELQFTASFEAHMKGVRATYVERALAAVAVRHNVFKTASEEDKAVWEEGNLGIMCPAAAKDGGVRRLSDAMATLFASLT